MTYFDAQQHRKVMCAPKGEVEGKTKLNK